RPPMRSRPRRLARRAPPHRAARRSRRPSRAVPEATPSVIETSLPGDSHRSGRLARMDHVNLGATGLRVSRLCLGMMSFGQSEGRPWALAEADADPIVRRAVDGGITFFDTA